MNNIYLIPVGESGYKAVVAKTLPTYDAILLAREKAYPAPIWSRRTNKYMQSQQHFETANSRDELICKLNVLGREGAAIHKIWDTYCVLDKDLDELFACCYKVRSDAYWQITQNV